MSAIRQLAIDAADRFLKEWINSDVEGSGDIPLLAAAMLDLAALAMLESRSDKQPPETWAGDFNRAADSLRRPTT